MKARATKGKRAYGKCPNNRGKYITLIGAIATSGILALFNFEGWTNKPAFLTYVSYFLGALSRQTIRDNLRLKVRCQASFPLPV